MIDFMSKLFPASSQRLSSEPGGWNSGWTSLLSVIKSVAGIAVTPESAMRQVTVYACVRVLAETLAQFPIHVYKRLPGGMKALASDHPLNHVLSIAPNPWQTSFEYREMMMGHLVLRGNAYSLIVPGVHGAVSELWPLHPDRVTVRRLENMRLLYTVTNSSGQPKDYTQDEIFHLRGLSSDGMTGLSPIALARDAIGTLLAAERYGGTFFKNAARPSGYLKGPPAMKPADAKTAQQTFMEAYAGEDNWHKPMVLWGGLEWQDIGMTNKDAEFIETLDRGDKQIPRIFRVQPHKVGIMDDATFSNIEQQNQEFVGDTMLPWCRRWEEAIGRDLISDEEHYVRFNFEGLLRADSAARTAFYSAAIQNAWMSPNEVRELEDLPPYEGGDNYFIQGGTFLVDHVINPPQPVVQQLPDPAIQQESDDREQEQAVEIGKLTGQCDVLRLEITNKDNQIATARSEVDRLAAEVKEKTDAISRNLATAAQLAEATDALLAAQKREEELESARLATSQELSILTATTADLQADIARIARERDASMEQATELQTKLSAAEVENVNLLTACARRMQALEAESVQRAVKKKNFAGDLNQVYESHAERMLEAFSPLIAQRTLFHRCLDPGAFVTSHIEESKSLLLEAFKGDVSSAPERMQACLERWPSRAEQILNKLTPPKETEATNANTED